MRAARIQDDGGYGGLVLPMYVCIYMCVCLSLFLLIKDGMVKERETGESLAHSSYRNA